MTITSAYNFVPLASKVVCPDWAPQVSHDLPLPEGVCAEIRVRWTNHTPLLVGSGRDGQDLNRDGVQCVRPFQHPDGIHALPGSSLRGMLRNVIEIASFSRMNLVDDTDLSIRDFTDKSDYLKAMVGGEANKPAIGGHPKSRPAWLWFDGQHWQIKETKACRVQQTLICDKYFPARHPNRWPIAAASKGTWRPTAREKYESLISIGAAGNGIWPLSCWYLAEPDERLHAHGPKPNRPQTIYLRYRLVDDLHPIRPGVCSPSAEAREGVLVLTGQPGTTKHMEFVFEPLASRDGAVPVDKKVFATFAQIHGHPEGDWKSFWERRALNGEAIPVFVLGNGNAVANIGLAQMMRLQGKQSIGTLRDRHYDKVVGGHASLDFTTTLFGRVGDKPGDLLRSRVAFGDARLSSRLEADDPVPKIAVLGQPKPSFYPNYLVQNESNGTLRNSKYNTLLSSNPSLRGWKRYPVRNKREVEEVVPPHDASPKLKVELHPLGQANFESTIRLHNVKPQELGAVLWALIWGGGSHLHRRHALGMGKSFGYGQVQATVIGLDVRPNARPAGQRNGADDRPLNARVGDYIGKFTGFMSDQVPKWISCAEMKELLAMADPGLPQANKSNLRPLALTVKPKSINEFTDAKKGGWVLPPYSTMGKKP